MVMPVDTVVLQGASTACTDNGGSGLPWSVNDSDSPCPPTTTLDLSSLVAALVIPPTGALTLRRLRLSGARLPTSPFPLPASTFMALSAVRLQTARPPPAPSPSTATTATTTQPPGDRPRPLVLQDLIILTPSCTSLSLHQDFACRTSPSPNFTVTPASLTIHRYTTPTIDITNVTLLCAVNPPQPLLPPCLAATASSGAALLRTAGEHQSQAAHSLLATGYSVPSYIYLARDTTLSWTDLRSSLGANASSGGGPLDSLVIGSAPLHITGHPDGNTVLDLTDSTGLIAIRKPGSVHVSRLTLTNPPPGNASELPFSLLRLPLWTFTFTRIILGASGGSLLSVADATVLGLPRSELALLLLDSMWETTFRMDPDRLPTLPAALAGWECVAYNGVFHGLQARLVPDSPSGMDMHLQEAHGWSQVATLSRLLLRPPADTCAFAPPDDGSTDIAGPASLSAPRAPAPAGGPALPASPPSPRQCGPRDEPLFAALPEAPDTCAAPALVPFLKGILLERLGMLLPRSMSKLAEYSKQLFMALRVRDTYMNLWPNPWPNLTWPGPERLRYPTVLFGSPLEPRLLDLRGLVGAITLLASAPNVSLTVRNVVLLNLPPADGCRSGLSCEPYPLSLLMHSLPPGNASVAVSQSASAPTLEEDAPEPPLMRMVTRRLQQATAPPPALPLTPHPPMPPSAPEARDSSPTRGMTATLTNLTSCLWTLDFDRTATVDAAGGSSGGGASAAPSGRVAGLPYVFLDSVVLVLPQAELDWIAGVMSAGASATSLSAGRAPLQPAAVAAAMTTDSGLAEQLAALLADSVLAATPSLPHGPSASPQQAAGSSTNVTSLTFRRLRWCGLQGRNVTLTSRLRYPTRLVQRPTSFTLPDLGGVAAGLQPRPEEPTARPPDEEATDPQRLVRQSPPVDALGDLSLPGLMQQPPSSLQGPAGEAAGPSAVDTPTGTAQQACGGGSDGAGCKGSGRVSRGVLVAVISACTGTAALAGAAIAVLALARLQRQLRYNADVSAATAAAAALMRCKADVEVARGASLTSLPAGESSYTCPGETAGGSMYGADGGGEAPGARPWPPYGFLPPPAEFAASLSVAIAALRAQAGGSDGCADGCDAHEAEVAAAAEAHGQHNAAPGSFATHGHDTA